MSAQDAATTCSVEVQWSLAPGKTFMISVSEDTEVARWRWPAIVIGYAAEDYFVRSSKSSVMIANKQIIALPWCSSPNGHQKKNTADAPSR